MNAISRYFFTLNQPKEDLQDVAARVISRHSMLRLCKNCRQPYKDHTEVNGDWCPERWPSAMRQRHFVEMTCEACNSYGSFDPGQQCGRECIPGLPVCPEHLAESLSEGDRYED